jgi:hypothetical protein
MTDMMRTDDELRRALRRVEPPAGFAERVLRLAAGSGARAAAPRRGRMHRLLSGPTVRWATAAALAVAVTGGVWYRAEQHRQAQGEEMRRQVMLSLRIAGGKLQSVQARVNQPRAQ